MKAIRKKPGCEPELVEVENTLKALQAEVGGYIETVTIASDVVVICNEEGVPLGMPYNCRFVDVDFVGPILVVGRNKDEFCDVPEADFLMHHLRGEEDINQAIRILDPATTAEELATIEYYGGLHGREKMVAACDEACRVAVRIMRKYLEEQK